jgi:hypothetical protein
LASNAIFRAEARILPDPKNIPMSLLRTFLLGTAAFAFLFDDAHSQMPEKSEERP